MKCGIECSECKDRAPFYSFLANLSLAIYKGFLGVISGSAALMADALHSLADVVCSLVTMVCMKISAKEENETYQYGYGKIQYFSMAIVGIILFLGALVLFFKSAALIFKGTATPPHAIAVWGALLSIVINEVMYRYQMCVSKENNSPALKADALDNRSDAMSSVGVFFGIIGAVAGFPVLDPLAAMFVAFLVLKIGVELVSDALKGLLDGSIEIKDLKKIYQAAQEVKGVRSISYARGRFMGEKSWVDIEIEVSNHLEVEKADKIANEVRLAIEEVIDHIGEVTVFCKPISGKEKFFSLTGGLKWLPFGKGQESESNPEKA
ncbi:MAG: magnetosome biogenesis CDF transporter MamB [Nitrospina sp.]|jgi:cation diffusion facilitator family transporter|nr:magnetosome biogenesis CDF transporter MamB [Nitrospina sp.]MBT5633648.1 magnetosome biogenesis CDF transporter MamB [Nitrospina sp.]